MREHVQKGRLPALEEFRAQLLRAAQSEGGRRAPLGATAGVWVVAGLTLVTAGVGIGIATRSEQGQMALKQDRVTPPRGPALGSSSRGTYYASLPELIAKTKLVVTGTVQQVLIGKVLADDPEFPTRYLNTVLTVDETLKGSAPSGTIVVETRELAFGHPRGPDDWRTPGSRVLLFLSASSEEPAVYILSNAGGGANYEQSVYILDGADVIATTHDPVAEQLAALSLDQVRQTVQSEKGG